MPDESDLANSIRIRKQLLHMTRDPGVIRQLQRAGLKYAELCLRFYSLGNQDPQVTAVIVFDRALARVVGGSVRWDLERFPRFQEYFEAVIRGVVQDLSASHEANWSEGPFASPSKVSPH